MPQNPADREAQDKIASQGRGFSPWSAGGRPLGGSGGPITMREGMKLGAAKVNFANWPITKRIEFTLQQMSRIRSRINRSEVKGGAGEDQSPLQKSMVSMRTQLRSLQDELKKSSPNPAILTGRTP